MGALTTALTSNAQHLHACIRPAGGLFEYSLTQISQNIINCKKIKLKFVVTRHLHVSDCRYFPGTDRHKVPVAVAMRLKCGVIFSDYFITRLLLCLKIK